MSHEAPRSESAPAAPGLRRCLGLWEIVVYGVGLILGAGIYVLIGATAGIAGNMLWLSFLLAAIVAGFTALSYAELSTLFPQAAAEFVFVREAFGSETLSWMVGFCAVLVGFTTASAVAVGFAQYLNLFVPGNTVVLALTLVTALSLLSFWGIKASARFNAVATTAEVGGLVLIIVVGAWYMSAGAVPVADLLALPDAPSDHWRFLPIVSAGALIFFAFMGFEDIANIAEEAENPALVLPRAFMYSLAISSAIYVLVAIVAVSVVPYRELAGSSQPLSLVMERLIGGGASGLIAGIALFATANTVLITLIVTARMLYGMARNRSLPGFLARVHARRRTPHLAVLVTCLLSIAFLFFERVEVLASIADVGIFILFFFVNLANVVLRYRRSDLARPWRVPLSVGPLPVPSVLGAASCLAMLATIDHPVALFGRHYSSLVVGLAIFAMALPLYYLLARR